MKRSYQVPEGALTIQYHLVSDFLLRVSSSKLKQSYRMVSVSVEVLHDIGYMSKIFRQNRVVPSQSNDS